MTKRGVRPTISEFGPSINPVGEGSSGGAANLPSAAAWGTAVRAIRRLPLLLLLAAGCAPEPPARRVEEPAAAPPAESLAVSLADTAADAGALEIRFLDVGQGDATLIRHAGRTVLVDAGPSDRIVRRLRELAVDTIDLLIASHNHADHIGGMDAVLDSLPVRSFLDNGVPAATRIQRRVLERVEAGGVRYLSATERSIGLGEASLRILPAPEGIRGDDQNNRSVTVLLQRDTFRALLPGDAEVELLGALLERYDLPDLALLKAAHHGSRNGVTPAWLSRLRPEVVLIGLAADNSYGHPHAAALRYYCAGGRRILRTDLVGEVVVRVHAGGGYDASGAREDPPAPVACEGRDTTATDRRRS